jgi:hypothetical protein
MQHLRTIPKLGARLEQFMFACPSCEKVETKEVLDPKSHDCLLLLA